MIMLRKCNKWLDCQGNAWRNFCENRGQYLTRLKAFHDFLYWNSKYEEQNHVLPSSSQPAQLYGTAKTHKCFDLNNISVESSKFNQW